MNFNEELLEEEIFDGARIKVVGVGGGGGNAVNYMIEKGIQGVSFAVYNTDVQALRNSLAEEKLKLGGKESRGLGAGSNPEIGKHAAEISSEEIAKSLAGYNMVFILAGLGGGTGTGASPVVAKIAREMDILTVAVVTLPFSFEGKKRLERAIKGLKELENHVDTYIVVPNNRLSEYLNSIGEKLDIKNAFGEANKVATQAIKGITDTVTVPGLINLDFADLNTTLKMGGSSVMGMGHGSGENRIAIAAEKAINNPLLEHDISGAKGIMVNICGSESIGFDDFEVASELVKSYIDEDECEVFVGMTIDDTMNEDEIQITIIATGFDYDAESYAKGKLIKKKPISDLHSRYTRDVDFNYRSDIDKELEEIKREIDFPSFMEKRLEKRI